VKRFSAWKKVKTFSAWKVHKVISVILNLM